MLYSCTQRCCEGDSVLRANPWTKHLNFVTEDLQGPTTRLANDVPVISSLSCSIDDQLKKYGSVIFCVSVYAQHNQYCSTLRN